MKNTLPALILGCGLAACDATPGYFASNTPDQIWAEVSHTGMGPRSSLFAIEDICNGRMADAKQQALEEKLAGTETPMPGLAYFGKMYLDGDCVPEDRARGEKLLRLGLMSLLPAMYQETKLEGMEAKPPSILPFGLGQGMDIQIQAVVPKDGAIWEAEIRRWLASPPADLVAEAEAFRSGSFTFFGQEYDTAMPQAGVNWMLAASYAADDGETLKQTIRWLFDPALAPYWAASPVGSKDFDDMNASLVTEKLLYLAELRDVKPAYELYYCLAFQGKQTFRAKHARTEYIHLQLMKQQGIAVDDALLQEVHALMLEDGKGEAYIPSRPEPHSMIFQTDLVGRCGI